jgi:hypothetical protein
MPLSTGHKGIDVRQTANRLIFDALLQDMSGILVTAGTAKLYLYELQSDYTLNSYDFSNNTFTSGVLTNAFSNLTHQRTVGNTVNTGIWTSGLTILTGFSNSGIYYTHVNHTNAFPNDQMRKFQFGSEQGDVVVTDTFVQSKMGNTSHGGTDASIRLGFDSVNTPPLYITNASGDAVHFYSNGNNGDGFHVQGHGTSHGFHMVGGATGYGLFVDGGGTIDSVLGNTTATILGDVLGSVDRVINASGIADAVLMRNVSGVEQQMPEHCLGTIVLATLEHSISGGTLTIKRADGSTTLYTKTLTSDPAADPITGIQ